MSAEKTGQHNSKELSAVHLVEEFTGSATSLRIFTMRRVLASLIDAGELQVFVGTIFPLATARVACARARSGLRRGKVALRVAQ